MVSTPALTAILGRGGDDDDDDAGSAVVLGEGDGVGRGDGVGLGEGAVEGGLGAGLMASAAAAAAAAAPPAARALFIIRCLSISRISLTTTVACPAPRSSYSDRIVSQMSGFGRNASQGGGGGL